MFLEPVIISAFSVEWFCFSRLEEDKRIEKTRKFVHKIRGFLYEMSGDNNPLSTFSQSLSLCKRELEL